MKKLLFLAVTAVVLFVTGAIAVWNVTSPYRQFESDARGLIGKTEVEVVQRLGAPAYTVSASDLGGRSVDFPWRDMHYVPVPTRPVRNKVLLYRKLNIAVYVYIDPQGIVEHVAIAGT
jgi:hypothetical protein